MADNRSPSLGHGTANPERNTMDIITNPEHPAPGDLDQHDHCTSSHSGAAAAAAAAATPEPLHDLAASMNTSSARISGDLTNTTNSIVNITTPCRDQNSLGQRNPEGVLTIVHTAVGLDKLSSSAGASHSIAASQEEHAALPVRHRRLSSSPRDQHSTSRVADQVELGMAQDCEPLCSSSHPPGESSRDDPKQPAEYQSTIGPEDDVDDTDGGDRGVDACSTRAYHPTVVPEDEVKGTDGGDGAGDVSSTSRHQPTIVPDGGAGGGGGDASSMASAYPTAAVAFLMISTVFQSFAGSGLQAVLELYFSTFLFPHTVHGLSKKRRNKLSTTSMNLWVGLQQVVALSAGYLADKKWGNYRTQIVSNSIAALGSAMLIVATWHLGTLDTVSSGAGGDDGLDYASILTAVASQNTSSGDKNARWRDIDMAASFLGLALIAVGYGQAQTIQSVFVGNQFSAEQKEAKRKSFSWYYLFCNVGSLGGELGGPVLRQSVHFLICISTIAGSFIISTVVFITGHRTYKRTDITSHDPAPETQASFRETGVQMGNGSGPSDPDLGKGRSAGETSPLLGVRGESSSEHDTGTQTAPQQRTWRETLSEIKPVLGVFVPLIVYWSLFFQQNSTWVLQGQEMNCYLGKLKIPPDAMPSFNDCLVILIIPLLDYIVYPHLKEKLGFVATPIRRIGLGILCTIFSFILAGLLQLYISHTAEQRGNDDSTDCHGNVSIAWQMPQYVLISFAEVLVAVTGLEFAYSQAPDRLRNVVTSLWFLSQAFGTLLVAVLAEVPIPIRYQYFVYTALMCILFSVYVWINKNFRYRQGTQDC
ncbi:solute carrier family 15 member 4-like [Sycon ciliatum]|uniref:solute carrier family 15 member 4-like n=1 Tax=Sycon ciliatum TaxID=27933 RepID=UPI0031F6A5FC